MKKFLALLVLAWVASVSGSTSAFAVPDHCELTLKKAQGAGSYVTSIVHEGEFKSERATGRRIWGGTLKISADKTLYAVVIMQNDDILKASVHGPDAMPLLAAEGMGAINFTGKIVRGNRIVLSGPLKGSIAPGYLKDREDMALVDFDGAELACFIN